MYEAIFYPRGCTHKDIISFERSKCKFSTLNKLDVYDWLNDISRRSTGPELVEVRFKNTRKGFYLNSNQLYLQKGDFVAVEANPGMDVGVVSLTGELVTRQMSRAKANPNAEYPKIFRKAKTADIEKWKEAVESEIPTMYKAREVAQNLGLNMKIGDVEFQGDRTKAIFYYTADERVDFRQLIKLLADTFRIRIEMRQIGARQEAGQIGGIGSCGRELCCSTCLTNFASVSTTAARHQEISPNPQKLTGQCGKLKCCLNYEVNTYIDAQKEFPERNVVLETLQGPFYRFKTDIFKRILWYSQDLDNAVNVTPLPLERVWEIIQLNRKGIKVTNLADKNYFEGESAEFDFRNEVGSQSLTRFDDKKRSGKKGKANRRPDRSPSGPMDRADSGSAGATSNRPVGSEDGTRDRKFSGPPRPRENSGPDSNRDRGGSFPRTGRPDSAANPGSPRPSTPPSNPQNQEGRPRTEPDTNRPPAPEGQNQQRREHRGEHRNKHHRQRPHKPSQGTGNNSGQPGNPNPGA